MNISQDGCGTVLCTSDGLGRPHRRPPPPNTVPLGDPVAQLERPRLHASC